VVVPGGKGSVATILRTDDEASHVGPLLRLLGFYTAAVALALLLFVYFLLTRLVVQPIDALSGAARRVASGGRMLERSGAGAAELLDLGSSLAEMTSRLRDEEAALRSKIGELEATTAELRAAQVSLVRSERLASVGRLAAGLAHEVGNPLAALIGLQDLLLDGGLTPEEERDFVGRMRKETERIHRIVRDLLDYARPASIGIDRPAEPGTVQAALDDVASLLRPQKGMRDVALSIDAAPDLPPVALAHEQLVQLAHNLISNASDAMNGEGKISVRARLEPGDQPAGEVVVIEVEDDGPGIDPSVAQTLFEPFVTTKDVGKGTGLGLAVCRGLVEGVGGSITAGPRPGGERGTRFVVTLPSAAGISQRSPRRA
jgi:two-component system, NtrC family, sensor kinase